MGSKRAGTGHGTVLWLEPGQAASTVGGIIGTLILGAVAVLALAYPSSELATRWPPDEPIPTNVVHIAAAVAAGLALICLLVAGVNARRWHTTRVVKRMSNDPGFAHLLPPADAASPAPALAAHQVPSLAVAVRPARKVPKLHARPHLVTPTTNVIGGRPLRILYLRLFENQPRSRTFMESAWREFGHVALLRSAASVTPHELHEIRRDGDIGRMFIDSPERLRATLDGADRRPLPKGRHVLRNVSPHRVVVRDRYGAYPVVALLCHGGFWQSAVDQLLTRSDLVVLDLSGYRQKNQGTRHEIEAVVGRVPIERVVFLADEASNTKFLAAQLQEAWAHMAAGSPNATPGRREAVIVVTDRIARNTSTDSSGNTQETVRLVADRRRSRWVGAAAQARAGGW